MEWKSVGIMTFPTEWKVIKFIPNDQSEYIYPYFPILYIFLDYMVMFQSPPTSDVAINTPQKTKVIGDGCILCPWALRTAKVKPQFMGKMMINPWKKTTGFITNVCYRNEKATSLLAQRINPMFKNYRHWKIIIVMNSLLMSYNCTIGIGIFIRGTCFFQQSTIIGLL